MRQMKHGRALGGMLMCMAVGAFEARADARQYVWSYDALTMPAGTTEVEYYLTTKVPDTQEREVSSWQHQIEVERGLTPRWDVAMYQVWSDSQTADGGDLKYEGFKLRTRYRITEDEPAFVNALVYAEYKRAASLPDPDVGEAKLILSRSFGRFDLTYNQIFERALSSGGSGEHKYAAGVGYAILPGWHVGIESAGNYTEGVCAAGPTLAASGPGAFLALGVLLDVDDSADLQARLILGIGL